MKYSSACVIQLKDRKGKPWQARLKYKDSATGKWKETSKMLPEVKGKREAQKIANEWLAEMNEASDNMPTIKENRTISEMYEEYLSFQLTTGEIEKSSYINSIGYYKEYIKPYLGNYDFASIDKTVINIWLTKLYNKGLSQNTIHTIFARLQKLYNHYYKTGDLIRNPFLGVKAPKRGTAKISHLTNEQMDEILTAVYANYKPKDPMYVGILLAFYAGLRRGEILGLRWRDVDFENGLISINSAIGIGGSTGAYTKAPKNNSSIRTFPMLPQLKRALQERKEAVKPENNWFVCGYKQKFMAPQTFSHQFSRFVEQNNLVDAYGKKLVPHALRHNVATVGIRSGMDIASLSVMMGHASRAMTLDIYGDANADALSVALEKLGETFKKDTSLDKDIESYLQGENNKKE